MNECPECNSKDVRVAIHSDYKECNKCYHFWEVTANYQREMEKPLDKVFICDRIQHFSNKLVKACKEGDEVLTGHYAAKIRGFLEQLER